VFKKMYGGIIFLFVSIMGVILNFGLYGLV